jgi:hypothetical protein
MSVGEAAARGLQAGFSMGMQGIAMKNQEEDRKRRLEQEERDRAERMQDRAETRVRQGMHDARLSKQDERAAAQDARQVKQDERQRRIDGLTMLDKEIADLQTEGTSLWTQYGGFDKVPEDIRSDYTGRAKTARQRRAEERRKFYEPDVQEAQRDAAEKWSRIEAGQMTLDDLSDDDLYRTLTVQTRRNLAEFLRPKDGGPSAIEQAALDLEAGMQTGNQDLTLRAANVLLKPELQTGVGTEGPDGSEIVSKRIVKMAPHPQDPSQFVPIVEVTVKRDDGATGKYLAPISEGRGVYANDPQAMPKAISVKDALDRVGQLSTLAAAVNRPDMRKRIEKGAAGSGKASGDEFLAALGSVGVTPPKKQISRERVDLGSHVLEREVDASGNILSEKKLGKGLAPSRGTGGAGGAADARFEAGLKAALARGDITDAEAKEARRRKVLNLKPADEAKKAKATEKEQAKKQGAIQQADRLIGTVDSALKKVGGLTAGLGGTVLQKLPGSDARDLASELETIKANLGFAELQAMREASPTGGALGQVAVQELIALQATVASLDQRQSPAQLKQSLGKIRQHYQKWKQAVEQGGDEGDDEQEEEVTAINPQTGETLILRGGQWQPK